ncbi:MAJOR FACILITATOR SUPERFAMILY PROTEIN [Salix purpurea]|uniref:MAJOR FACILITATOR SUPERFAMILY PROTEIN n=1 Tax=Salix purpurea TaxID=77065 RepID=A0A9Q0WAP3_SALPP|nr:MAJOR FACILITATOR SUPERFAMILY PROTEIN [Salix purpurea]
MASKTLQWLSLVGIIWLQSVNGTNSNFPAYSSQLKQLLSMSQVQLNNLAFASDAGKLFGFFPGIAALYFPLWLVLLIGSVLGLAGYGLQYLFITDQISSLSYAHIFLLTVLAGNSICWINTVCYVVTIQNFPSDRQVAVGLTTSYQGLSAKIYTALVDSFTFSPVKRAKAYLLLNSLLPLLVSLMSALFVRDVNARTGNNMKVGFVAMFVLTIATGIYAVVSSFGSVSSRLPPLGNAIGISVFLLAPLAIPMAEKMKEKFLNGEMKVYIEENVGDHVERIESGIKAEDDQTREDDGVCVEEIGAMLMLKRVNFWLYFFVYLSGATLGLVYLNNLGQIAESRGNSGTSSLVSLSSSFGFFGRLMPSLLEFNSSRSRYMKSRPACIAALMAPMAGAFFLLLSTANISLYISTAIIGVCTGAITSISVSTTTELFGTKNFGVNHNVVVANIPVGSFIFGYSAALFYRREASEDGKCMGMECYRNTFIIWGSLCLLGTFLALVLHARLRKFYSHT